MTPQLEPTAIAARLQAFILQHPASAHTAAQLAKHAEISTITLKKLLYANYGLTVQQFITTVRMKNAAELLSQHFTIKDISIQSGYSDLASFYRCFKKYFGITPLQFRKQHSH